MYSAEKAKRKGAGYEYFNNFLGKTIEAYNGAKSDVLNASPDSVDENTRWGTSAGFCQREATPI